MNRKLSTIIFLCAGLCICAACAQPTACAQPQDALEDFEEEELSLTGELIKIKMTQSPDNPWEELALKNNQGRIYILIGSAVEQLLPLVGKTVTIEGYTKPPMRAQGSTCTVVEIEQFSLADPQDK